MSPELHNLQDAIAIITVARREVLDRSANFAWNKLYNAGRHLEKQVYAYFAPGVAA